MTLVIKAQEILFSTIDNMHSSPINATTQVVLELVSLITLWIRGNNGVGGFSSTKLCIKWCSCKRYRVKL